MIRNFELFCKLNRIKLSELQIFYDSIAAFQHLSASCPACGAKGALNSHGYYQRDLISFKERQVITSSLSVPRFKCGCGHTHAILPACLIPYGSYGLLFILTVLRAYFLHFGTVAAICESFSISISTLYAWALLFRCHKALWLGILRDIESSPDDFLSLLFHQTDFLYHFFLKFAASFLQGMSFATSSRQNPLPPDS